jgi:hypothetical protein
MISIYLDRSYKQEPATDTCVYKRVLRKPAGEPKDILKDAATDPTLPRTRSIKCYNCGHPEAAFFQVSVFVLFTYCSLCDSCYIRCDYCIIYSSIQSLIQE